MSTNISITNNQNLTSNINNQNNNINSAFTAGSTFIIPSRRTVLLLASDPTLAITSNGENNIATLTTLLQDEYSKVGYTIEINITPLHKIKSERIILNHVQDRKKIFISNGS